MPERPTGPGALSLLLLLGLWSPAALAGAASVDGAPPAAVTTAAAPAHTGGHPTKPARAPKRGAHGKSSVHWIHRNDPPKDKMSGQINESVALTPFPSQAAAAKKALAQNRRDVLDDAERAARAASQDDRWQTVLFSLRDLDARSDPEGCFWRLVAYYRMGQIERARQIREGCDLPSRDLAMLEAEDAGAAALQPALALAERDHPPAPVVNPAPYSGAAPTRLEK